MNIPTAVNLPTLNALSTVAEGAEAGAVEGQSWCQTFWHHSCVKAFITKPINNILAFFGRCSSIVLQMANFDGQLAHNTRLKYINIYWIDVIL